jgi:hypothetical protein
MAVSFQPVGRADLKLLLKNLFNLPDFLLNLAGDLLASALVGQVGVVGDPTSSLLNLALYFVKLPGDPILCARFHVLSSIWLKHL